VAIFISNAERHSKSGGHMPQERVQIGGIASTPVTIVGMLESQKPLPPEYAKTVDENFWELI